MENKVMKSVSATQDEWNKLYSYLVMSKSYRLKELEGWKTLAEEKDEFGNAKFSKALDNVAFYEEMITVLESFEKKIPVV